MNGWQIKQKIELDVPCTIRCYSTRYFLKGKRLKIFYLKKNDGILHKRFPFHFVHYFTNEQEKVNKKGIKFHKRSYKICTRIC